MTCHEAREQFSALVDDALGADARAALDVHLAGCVECRRELDGFQRTVALIRGIEPARAPAGFVDRVLTRTRPEPWSRRLARRLFQPWPVKLPLEAAALLIVGVLAVWLFQRMPEQQQALRAMSPTESRLPQSATQPQQPIAQPRQSVAQPQPAVTQPQQPVAQQSPGTLPQQAAAKFAPAAAPPVAGEENVVLKPAPPGQASVDSRESTDTFRPAPRREEARGQSAPEGLRDQPAAEAKRPQIQSTAKERDKDPAVGRVLGLAAPLPPSQVAGRLAAPDREQAERELVALVARHNGTTLWRRGDGRVTLIDIEVPRSKYPQFIVELGRIGRWTVERDTRELPETVRLQIQLE